MSGAHEIEWEFDAGILRGRPICNAAPDADCHLVGTAGCECESITLERDPDGTPFHQLYNGGELEPEYIRHEMVPADYCNIATWLENEDELVELFSGAFIIGRTAIEPVWAGDYYEWKPAAEGVVA